MRSIGGHASAVQPLAEPRQHQTAAARVGPACRGARPAARSSVEPPAESGSSGRVGRGRAGGGEGGIRTLDGLPHTAFPVPRPRPLGDLSEWAEGGVAEREGFEPSVLAHTAFRERHHQPLGHLSTNQDSKGSRFDGSARPRQGSAARPGHLARGALHDPRHDLQAPTEPLPVGQLQRRPDPELDQIQETAAPSRRLREDHATTQILRDLGGRVGGGGRGVGGAPLSRESSELSSPRGGGRDHHLSVRPSTKAGQLLRARAATYVIFQPRIRPVA